MKGGKWSGIKKRIAALAPKDQLALFKEVYDLSSECREFLSTKLQTEEEVIANFSIYLDRALEPFDIKGVLTKKELAKAKNTIRAFQKACSDHDAVVELMLCFVEEGTKFTFDFGDMFEAYYLILEEVLTNLVSILKSRGGKQLYNDDRRTRFLELAEKASVIGWGYGDFVGNQVADLEERFAKPGKRSLE